MQGGQGAEVREGGRHRRVKWGDRDQRRQSWGIAREPSEEGCYLLLPKTVVLVLALVDEVLDGDLLEATGDVEGDNRIESSQRGNLEAAKLREKSSGG